MKKPWTGSAAPDERCPEQSAIYTLMARLYEANKDLANAEINLKKAIELAPNQPAGYTSLADFYLRHQFMDKAKAQYNATLCEKIPMPFSPIWTGNDL